MRSYRSRSGDAHEFSGQQQPPSTISRARYRGGRRRYNSGNTSNTFRSPQPDSSSFNTQQQPPALTIYQPHTAAPTHSSGPPRLTDSPIASNLNGRTPGSLQWAGAPPESSFTRATRRANAASGRGCSSIPLARRTRCHTSWKWFISVS